MTIGWERGVFVGGMNGPSIPDARQARQEAMMHRLWVKTAVQAVVLIGAWTNLAGAASWADSLFSEKGHDFGPVAGGGKVRHDFILTNRLSEPITIVNVRASCGCTSGK